MLFTTRLELSARVLRVVGRGADGEREMRTAVHPVVIRHPVSGTKALYVNGIFTTELVELQRRRERSIAECAA